jgi:hypothetical protein
LRDQITPADLDHGDVIQNFCTNSPGVHACGISWLLIKSMQWNNKGSSYGIACSSQRGKGLYRQG